MTSQPQPAFTNTEKFSVEVERRFQHDQKTTLLDHATALLIEMEIDPSDGAGLISKSLKEKIRHQSSVLRLIKEKDSTTKLSF